MCCTLYTVKVKHDIALSNLVYVLDKENKKNLITSCTCLQVIQVFF